MINYLVVVHTVHDWPVAGRAEATNTYMFVLPQAATGWSDEKWMEEDVKDLQIYEYDGTQYVLIDRRHKDD